MDINTVYGLITLILLIIFVGIVLWAYNGRRQADFDMAARLPLDDGAFIERRVKGEGDE